MHKLTTFLLVFSVFVWTASSAYAGAQADVTVDPDEIAGTITFGGWPAADDAVEAILDGFYARYPNVEVVVEMTQTADHHDRLLTSLAARAGAPDVAMIEAQYIGAFRDRPGFINLLEEPYNAGRFEADFVDYKWEHGVSLLGDQMIGLPWDIGPLTLFYNRTMFEEAGLPTDPDEVHALLNSMEGFLEAARALTDEDQQWAVGNAVDIFNARWANRDYYDDDLSFRFDSEESIELINLAKQIRAEGLDANVEMWGPEWTSLLGENRLAMSMAGSWFGGFLKSWIAPEAEGEWGVARTPLFDATNWGGSFLAIPSMTNNPSAAWAFVEYALTTTEAQNTMFEVVDYYPAYTPAWDDPMYDESDPYFAGQRTRQLWAQIAEGTDPTMVTPMDAETEDILYDRIEIGIERGDDARAMLDDAIEAILSATAVERRNLIEALGLE